MDKVETSSNENIPDTTLTVAYDKRDRFGNIEHVLAKDAFDHERESTTIFDDEGVFPKREINALGHETVLEYDQRFGVLTKETDPNGLITEWQYDSFGREKHEARLDGSSTTTMLSRMKIDGAGRLSARTTTTGGADDETVFDSLGRPIRTLSYGPLSSRQMKRIEYDRLSGNVAKKSVPIAEGTPDEKLQWDVYEYDSIGREIRHVTPWNAITTTAYDGLVIDSVDPSSNHTKTVLDKRGRAKIVVDASSGITQYTYGAFDTLSTVTDPGGAKTTWTRDAFGRVTRLEEPDRGVTTYTHNGFGDLLASVDALGRSVGFDPDALGRTRTRTDTYAGKTLTTSWTWDTAPNGIGQLHTATSPDAIQSYSYNERGQLEGMAQTVEGSSFAVRQTYDNVGRAKSIDYPLPLGEEPFGVMYDFDEHGFIIGVREKNTNDSFWSLKDVDDTGRIRKERFGNEVETTRAYHHDKQMLEGITTTHGATNIQELAYDWDDRLNLKSRKDSLQVQHKAERFRYDELDRVTCAYFGAVEDAFAPCVTSYAYQANGNLWSKSDVGTYLYKDAKHPHAVTNVPGETFVYDAVGNQIARPGLVTLTYTPFDLPKTITKGGQTTTFGYDGDEHRVRKVSPTSETVYFADLFEQVTTVNGGARASLLRVFTGASDCSGNTRKCGFRDTLFARGSPRFGRKRDK